MGLPTSIRTPLWCPVPPKKDRTELSKKLLSPKCLNAVVKTSNIMQNKIGESGHPSLVSDLRQNALSFSMFCMILAVGLSCASMLNQSCPTLCDPLDSSLPSSSVHGILQARILEGVAMLSSRGSS